METIELVLAMLLAVIASSYFGKMLPFPVPLPLIQIVFGVLLEWGLGQRMQLDPDIFFLLFLSPLLFVDGWRIPKVGLFRDKATILEMALGLVVFTVVGAGYLVHWLIPAMPLPVAFALAAIVAPTDPVAVSSITERVPMPSRLTHIIEGESLLNDATSLVCFRFAVAAALTGQFSLAHAGLTFLWVACGGIAAGAAVTFAITRLHGIAQRRFGEVDGVAILINLLTPFGAYLAAEALGASGILAAVAGGISMSYLELSGRATPSTRIRRTVIWDTLQTALNGLMFVLLGEQLPGIARGALRPGGGPAFDPGWLARNALVFSLVLLLLRFVWVGISLQLTILNRRRLGRQVIPRRQRLRLVLTTSLAGVRGAVTMAGIFTLPLTMPGGGPFPARQLAIFLASCIIVLSLVLASAALPTLLRGLDLPEEPQATPCNADGVRRLAMQAAIDALERARRELDARPPADPEEGEARAQAIAHVLRVYQHRLPLLGDGKGRTGAKGARRAEREIRVLALGAERDSVLSQARRGRVSDATARRLLRNIDLLEARYRQD